MSTWTIRPVTNPGDERPFSDKLARTLRRLDANLAEGYVTFDKEGAPFEGAEEWAYGTRLTILKDGAPWFTGRRQLVNRSGAPRDERQSYTIADPWWFCRIIYNKKWKQSGLEFYWLTCHASMMCDATGAKIHAGQQITDCLFYVLNNADHLGEPRPFDIGPISIPPGSLMPWASQNIRVSANLPTFDVNGVSVLQAVQKVVAYVPDVCAWFDYSTVPPKLQIRRYAELEDHTFTVGQRPLASVPDLTACRDLQASVVIIHYERDGSGGAEIEDRQYPPEANAYAWDRVEEAFSLRGAEASYNTVTVTTKSIEPSSAAWWKEHCPEYSAPNCSLGTPAYCDDMPGRFYVNDGGDYVGLTRELVPGSPMPPDGSGKRALPQTYRCKIKVTFYDRTAGAAGAIKIAEEEVILVVNCTVTDCAIGTSDISEFVGGSGAEPIPDGIEKEMYDSLAMLHYKGTVNTIEREVTDTCTLGRIARFDGIEGELSTAKAMVQQVAWEVGSGSVSRTCGPPGHLGLADRWELARRSRFRLSAVRFESTGSTAARGVRIRGSAPGIVKGKAPTKPICDAIIKG
jgi:hypothetical protein